MFYFLKNFFYFYFLYKNIRLILNKNIKILYSLGFDSNLIFLFNIKLINKSLIKVYHINHNKFLIDKIISKFFKKFTINLKLKGFIININKKISIKQGLESNLRYKRIKKIKINWYNFGENLNDNLEYFFIKIFKKKIKNNKLFIKKYKPLKFIKKKKSKLKFKWLEDKSNNKIYFLRNLIRIKFIPILKKFFYIERYDWEA